MARKSLNLRWKEIQTEYQYETVLKSIQRVVVKTDLSNRYLYTKVCKDHPDYIPNFWFSSKNGKILYKKDDNGNELIPQEVDYFKMIYLKDILTGFYEDVDPITKIPYETPIDVQLR